jgi:ubiquinone/menaquinone biosynthesis C-methylase UbiE
MTTLAINVNELIEKFRQEEISYRELMGAVKDLSPALKENVLREAEKKQAEFWKETVNYYHNVHPIVPIVADDHETFLRTVTDNIPKGATMADLACGCGILIQKLLRFYPEKVDKIIGIDYIPGMLENAKSETEKANGKKTEIISYDLQRGVPLPSDSLDGAFSNWGIVYFRHPIFISCLQEVKRIIKPGQRFIFSALFESDADMPSVTAMLDEETLRTKGEVIKQGLDFERRLRILFPRYTKEELLAMTEEAGLNPVDSMETFYGRSLTIVAEC